MAIRIIPEPFPWAVEVDLPARLSRAAFSRCDCEDEIVAWLRANITDDDWIGYEKTPYPDGRKPIWLGRHYMFGIHFRHERDAVLFKLAFEGKV